MARKVAVLAAVVLGLGLLAGCVPPQLVLHGTITDAGTGDPVAGMSVRAYSSSSETVVAETVADDTGTYRFYDNQLADGSYHLRFGEAEWHDDAASWIDATPVAITSTTRTQVDAAVDPEVGTLTGTVSYDSTPLPSVGVVAYSTVTGAPIASAYTDATGTYTFEGLAAGEYWVRAGVEGMAFAYLGGTTTKVGATEVTVAEGATTTVGDIPLSLANRVDFRLLDAAVDGEPVHSIVVVALIDASLAEPPITGASGYDGVAQVLPLATDTYYFVLYDPTGTYPLRLVNDGGTPVALPVGAAGDFQELDIDMSTGQIIPPEVTPSSQALAVGLDHTCAVEAAGTVGCWGFDIHGQARPPLVEFASIDSYDRHSCGITELGEIECWGRNQAGQTDHPSGQFAIVTTGNAHSCAIDRFGTASCWGDDTYGQSTPPPDRLMAIDAGALHTCGLTTAGAAICWGYDATGQSTPNPGPFTAITSGGSHTCALRADGTASCWGMTPGGIPEIGPADYREIHAGANHTCALTVADEIVCDGANNWGQTDAPPGEWTTLASGPGRSCAVDADGAGACWGLNNSGSSDVPSGTFSSIDAGGSSNCGIETTGTTCWAISGGVPPGEHLAVATTGWTTCAILLDHTISCAGDDWLGLATPPPGAFAALSLGAQHGCALDADGAATCWGNDSGGQATPPPGVTFDEVAVGGEHTCGTTTSGSVECWGKNDYGQTDAPDGTFTTVSSGTLHSCGVTSDGEVLCWGWNTSGQSSPPTGTFVDVAAGYSHTCALDAAGDVTCWGAGFYREVEPLPGPFTTLDAQSQTTCGLRVDGSYRCWGLGVVGTWFSE